jgi:hypothetical protein
MITESLLIKDGLAGRANLGPEDSLQITLLAARTEHLRDTEVLQVVAVTLSTERCRKEGIRARPAFAHDSWGQVLGTGPSRCVWGQGHIITPWPWSTGFSHG